MKKKIQVWSCGGGTQSCAIAALIVQRKLPKPDISVIADTGYETQSTWDYMNDVLIPELRDINIDLVRVDAKKYATNPNAIAYPKKGSKNDFIIQVPVYTERDGSRAKLQNFCTSKWKIDVINRYVRAEHGYKRPNCCHWIGFSRDEQERWVKIMLKPQWKLGQYYLPLVNEIPISRNDAIRIVESMGWPTPPRSACWMCPNRGDFEWRKMIQERPEEFQKACDFEKEIQKTDPDAWLHKSCKPLSEVDFSQPEDLFTRPCNSGMCFV